jgi:AraC-like DNA-binding protein
MSVVAPPLGAAGSDAAVVPNVVLHARRDRARQTVRAAFPRRKGRLVAARNADECLHAFHTSLVDAVIVDLGSADDETWRVANLAREFPSTPFFGVVSLRVGEGSVLAAAAACEFADVFVDGVDDAVARQLVMRDCFSTRFARTLADPPPDLGLTSPLQHAAWAYIIAHAGRPIRTAALATQLRVTREHLSRVFAADGAPNLKRVIDLVRLIVAAELAKNPGHDLTDVARVLAFASTSHLSATAQRIVGTKPVSLTRLRAVDLVGRFARGRGRSRG